METLIKQAIEEVKMDTDEFKAMTPSTTRDKRVRAVIKAVETGKPILDMQRLIHAAGYTSAGILITQRHPKLAVAPAVWERVFARVRSYSTLLEFYNPASSAEGFSIPNWHGSIGYGDFYLSGAVPLVPPRVREAVPGWRNHYVVFEPIWRRELTDRATAVGDPILVRRLNQHLFAIEADWDMTPLEAWVSSL